MSKKRLPRGINQAQKFANFLRTCKSYRSSMGYSLYDRELAAEECRRWEKKLGIERIAPKQYLLLQLLKKHVKMGKNIDDQIAKLAVKAGYGEKSSERLGAEILRDVDDRLFEAVVGFGKKDIFYEVGKVIKQDEDLKTKMTALNLASKIVGLTEEDGKVQFQINTGNFDLAD